MDGMKLFGWLTLMISDKLDNIDVISRIEMEKSQFKSTFPHQKNALAKASAFFCEIRLFRTRWTKQKSCRRRLTGFLFLCAPQPVFSEVPQSVLTEAEPPRISKKWKRASDHELRLRMPRCCDRTKMPSRAPYEPVAQIA